MISHDLIVAQIPRLRRYARALTGNMDSADDLVQSTLERALEKWRLWQRERDLRPWLFSIMHNLHVDGYRLSNHLDYYEDVDIISPPSRANQEDALQIRDLERALALLPVDQREVLLMVGLEEMTYAQIAQALNVPQGTVMSRLSRARIRLKAILSGEDGVQLKVVNI